MTSVLIVGQPNVGKTSFVLNFAYYLGVEKLKLMIRQPAGFLSLQTYQLEQAHERLVSDQPHKTEAIQSIQLKLPVGKQDRKLRLVDSCGLINQIHPQAKIRKAMAQTLNELVNSQIVLHMIDLSEFNAITGLDDIDHELYNFMENKVGYKILANKLDLDINRESLGNLKKVVDEKLVIPISVIYQEGFKQVKSFLLENV